MVENIDESNTRELFASSVGNPSLGKHRRELLKKLAGNSTHPEIAEFAKGLMAGNITPRQAMASGMYSELLGEHVHGFADWYTSASESERDAAAARGQEYLDEVGRAEIVLTPERSAVRRRRPDADVYEESYDETDWTKG